MKPFNSSLNTDITKLKELRDSKGKNAEYKQMFKTVMERHNLSLSTVYTELGKDVPGSYKKTDRKAWMVKISEREMDLVAGLLVGGKPDHAICKEMSVEMGFSYSPSRLLKVRQKLSEAAQTILKNEPRIIKHIISDIKDDIKTPDQTTEEPPDKNLPASDSSARKFFYRLAGLDLKDMTSIVRLNFNDNEYPVSTRVIKECFDHIAASAVSGGKNIYELTKFDIETLLLQQLRYAKLNEYISPAELKQLTAIHRTLLQHEKSSASGGYSLDDVFSVVGYFSPSVTRQEVAKFLGA